MDRTERNKYQLAFDNARHVSKSLKNPKLRKPDELIAPPLSKTACRITVCNESCIEPFFRLIGKGQRPLLLNMANEFTPGGGVLKGSIAQEEFLSYVSNLYTGLLIAQEKGLYPLRQPFILERVSFFKRQPSSQTRDCLSRHYEGDVISCAALRVSSGAHSFTKEGLEDATNRIRKLLQVAAATGYRTLVLSALGCGAFHNPPAEVARIFLHFLTETEYSYCFDEIIFAVIEDRNSNNNFAIFRDILNPR